MDTEGWVNPCFFVNDEYVIRFNARDPGLPKYQREKFIFDFLKNSRIPVPQKVILDTSKDLIDYDILVSQKLKGRNLESDWPNLDKKTKSELSQSAGRLLKELHSLEFDFFGEFAGQGPLPQTQSWDEFLKAKLTYLLFEAKKIELFSKPQEEKFLSKFDSYKELMDGLTKSRLVHMDYHFGNLLYDQNKITGVVDFEWSIAGDPLYDLMSWRGANKNFPDSEESFFQGYGKTHFTSDEISLISLYQMMKNIELSIVAALHFSRDEAQDYLRVTLKALEAE